VEVKVAHGGGLGPELLVVTPVQPPADLVR
jgi:hypothetical protein